MENEKIESLKKQSLEQLKLQNFVDTALCKELIFLAQQEYNRDDIAIGHIWLAESYLLHEEDKIACRRALKIAKNYLNVKEPSEVLESYYSIEYKLYNALYDMQTAFSCCLKALEIAEQLYEKPELTDKNHPYFINTIENRIVKYYGNIGVNFFNQGIYEKALLYSEKALNILETLETVNVYAECLLRLNIIMDLIKIDAAQNIMHHIHLIEKLPIEPKTLKIYVDYSYVNYYLYKKDKVNIEFFIKELLNDETERYTDRLTAIEFYIDILNPILELNMIKQTQLLFDEVKRLVHDDEIRPLLILAKLKIEYANIFDEKEEKSVLYKEYYELFLKSEKMTNNLKANGLATRLKLNEIKMENRNAKSQIHVLEDIANYDGLTKIFNRRFLGMKYEELLNKNVGLLSLAIIDIDYFKEYNDNYGHPAGDEIVKIIAKCLQDALSDKMIACRYGGDEFVVLSWNENLNSLDSYTKNIVKTLKRMNIEHKMSKCSKQITVSVGVGSEKVHTQADIQTLFEKVDKALFLAKKRGRNQIVMSL